MARRKAKSSKNEGVWGNCLHVFFIFLKVFCFLFFFKFVFSLCFWMLFFFCHVVVSCFTCLFDFLDAFGGFSACFACGGFVAALCDVGVLGGLEVRRLSACLRRFLHSSGFVFWMIFI